MGMGMNSLSGTGGFQSKSQQAQDVTSLTPSSSSAYAKTSQQTTMKPSVPAKSGSGGGGGFDDLFSLAMGSSAKPATGTANKTIADLDREKSAASLWGSSASMGMSSGAGGAAARQLNGGQQQKSNAMSSGFEDLLG